jgi:hypothetical protein
MFDLHPTRAVGRFIRRVGILRDQARTRRILDGLPASLRKDIGWPDRYDERWNGFVDIEPRR